MGQSKAKTGTYEKTDVPCLYRRRTNKIYYAFIKHEGKIRRHSLETTDKATAKRKLGDKRAEITRVDKRAGKVTLAALCDEFLETVRCEPKTLREKKFNIRRIKKSWPGAKGDGQLIGKIRPAEVRKFLAGLGGGPTHYNAHLWLIRGVFDHAIENRLLHENPAAAIKAKKRDKPIRETPTREQFRKIVESIRSEKLNAKREESADLIEFMGLAGVGNAEVQNLTWGDVDFDGGKINLFRQKTRKGFKVPIHSKLKTLLKRRLGEEIPRPKAPVFTYKTARGALRTACKRLGYPQFDHRAFRRMFITNAIEKGIDVKVIAQWQGHVDGGKLILDTYSHVRTPHLDEMAKLLEDEEE